MREKSVNLQKPGNLLAADHGELDEMLDELFAAFETGDAGRIFKTLDMFWARLAMHIRAEHLHLFPAILKVFKSKQHPGKPGVPDFEAVKSSIENLKKDHNFFMTELAAAVRQMRESSEIEPMSSPISFSGIREKIAILRRRLETHNELEETEVYGWTDDLLNPAEIAVLNEKMQKELDNLPPRFGGGLR